MTAFWGSGVGGRLRRCSQSRVLLFFLFYKAALRDHPGLSDNAILRKKKKKSPELRSIYAMLKKRLENHQFFFLSNLQLPTKKNNWIWTWGKNLKWALKCWSLAYIFPNLIKKIINAVDSKCSCYFWADYYDSSAVICYSSSRWRQWDKYLLASSEGAVHSEPLAVSKCSHLNQSTSQL